MKPWLLYSNLYITNYLKKKCIVESHTLFCDMCETLNMKIKIQRRKSYSSLLSYYYYFIQNGNWKTGVNSFYLQPYYSPYNKTKSLRTIHKKNWKKLKFAKTNQNLLQIINRQKNKIFVINRINFNLFFNPPLPKDVQLFLSQTTQP